MADLDHSTEPSVFISVRYIYDQIVERSLSKFLEVGGRGHYVHDKSMDMDIVEKNRPYFFNMGFGRLYLGSLDKKPGAPTGDQFLSIIEKLVTAVFSHDVTVVIWSRHYATSFWTMLELKCALEFKKGIIVITTDDTPLDESLVLQDSSIFDFNYEYRTSKVIDCIRQLDKQSEKPTDPAAKQELMEFFANEYRFSSSPQILPDSQTAEYKGFIESLKHLSAHRLHGLFRQKAKSGYFKHDFRLFLELILQGKIETELDDDLYLNLLGKVLDYHFIYPILSGKIIKFYDDHIQESLSPPNRSKVISLVRMLKDEFLYNREFVEIFGHHIKEKYSTSSNTEKEVLNDCWSIVKTHIDFAV